MKTGKTNQPTSEPKMQPRGIYTAILRSCNAKGKTKLSIMRIGLHIFRVRFQTESRVSKFHIEHIKESDGPGDIKNQMVLAT